MLERERMQHCHEQFKVWKFKIFKIKTSLACQMLKIQNLACQLLKIQDFACQLMKI